jgi:hypothetical protein
VQDGGTRHRTTPADTFAFLASLAQLEALELQLPIRGFPHAMWMLPHLKSSVLSGFTAMELPAEFAELAASLTRLELSDCGLETVPPVICKCTGASCSPGLRGPRAA